MDTIVGIDLGTTNSEVAIVRDGRPVVLAGEDGEAILPSVVGLDPEGRLLVGHPARNQLALAPDRTVRSIKRKMGQEVTVPLGDRQYAPQEISAIILRTLKERAEKALGHPVKKAVITVPAFFTEGQRDATREAGELAGLEVARIINEPTAAVLTYDPHPPEMERLLVYDLGGDDFDQLLLDHVCHRFRDEHGVDLRDSPSARGRVLRAVEEAKKVLSTEAAARIEEEFIAESGGVPLHLRMEIGRPEYEELIEHLVSRTLSSVDHALDDAKLSAGQIDKVVLVGGATRTPLVQRLLRERLGRPLHSEIEPDLAVALGAAVQGALIAGVDVGPVLVDITPHTLGIAALGDLHGLPSPHCFAPIIPRNTPLPASRTEVFSTVVDGQKGAEIRVFQGEDRDTRRDTPVGEFAIEGLADVSAGNQIVVRLDLDLDGILNVTATERATGLARRVTIDNAMERFRARHRTDAIDRLDDLFGAPASDAVVDVTPEPEPSPSPSDEPGLAPELREAIRSAEALLAKAERALPGANPDDARELRSLVADLRSAVARRAEADIRRLSDEVEDLVFYLE
jgi:molecular chaperone DnaK